MKRTTLMISMIAAISTGTAIAQQAPAPKASAEDRGYVVKDIGVTRAEASPAVRLGGARAAGTPCNLLEGDTVVRLDKAADGTILARRTTASSLKRVPSIAAVRKGDTCSNGKLVKMTEADWKAVASAQKAREDQRTAEQARRSPPKKN